jgi:effector-binding domain-containing protein
MEKKLMCICHNTGYKEYRRARLVFYGESRCYEVTAEQLAILENDPRIEMHEVKTAKHAAGK